MMILNYGVGEVPKPGYSILIVSEVLKKKLELIAKAEGYRSVNQLLESWLRVNPGVYPNGEEKNLNSGFFFKI